VRLERLGQLKNPMTSSGMETATFRLVVPQPTTLPRTPEEVLVEYKIVSLLFRPKFVIAKEAEAMRSGKKERKNESEEKMKEKNKKSEKNEVK
jgi:hypothetical protein